MLKVEREDNDNVMSRTTLGGEPRQTNREEVSLPLSSEAPKMVQPPKPQPKTEPVKSTGKGSFLARLRKVKNIEFYVAGGVILLMIAIFATNFLGGVSNDQPNHANWNQMQTNFARDMEARLVQTLSQVRGAGRVEAMVTVAGSATLEIAYNIDERTVTQTGANGVSTTTITVVRTPVIINDRGGPRPLILMEIKPQIRGVVIVAQGAHDIGVRLAILRAAQALIADNTVNIEVLSGR
ncbi:MAG: hypothetical protein FWE16_01395 [Firmicutes bacterium]|nr:hypothetical protein [Bacillota bacterium]